MSVRGGKDGRPCDLLHEMSRPWPVSRNRKTASMAAIFGRLLTVSSTCRVYLYCKLFPNCLFMPIMNALLIRLVLVCIQVSPVITIPMFNIVVTTSSKMSDLNQIPDHESQRELITVTATIHAQQTDYLV